VLVEQGSDVAQRHESQPGQNRLLIDPLRQQQLFLPAGQVGLHLGVGQQPRGSGAGRGAGGLVTGAHVGGGAIEVNQVLVREPPLLVLQARRRVDLSGHWLGSSQIDQS